jgi:two-component system, LytTR family, response regulator
MIKAIVIDDEKKSRMALIQKLNDHCPEVAVLAEAENGLQGKELIEQYHPDLIFLDIEMPRMNGFEMVSSFRDKDFEIIFTTAYDQYGIQAIKCSAFDYLLKPVDIEELKEAVLKMVTRQTKSDTSERLLALMHNLLPNRKYGKKVGIPTMDGISFYNTDDIIHLEASSNYTFLFFKNYPKATVSKTLKEFEEILPPETFIRIHNSHIINIDYVKKYIKGEGGQVEMTNGNVIDVSRRKKDEFIKAIRF